MVRAVVGNTPTAAVASPTIDILSVGARHAAAGLPIRGWGSSPSPTPAFQPLGSSALNDGMSDVSSARSVGYGSDSIGSEGSIVDGSCMCYNCGHPTAALDDEWLYLFHPEDGHTLTLCERANGMVKEHKLERRYFGNTRYLRQFLKPNLYTRPLKFDVGQLCRDHQRGRCTRGTMCRFLHICQKLGITGPVPSRGTTPTQQDAFPIRGVDHDNDVGGFVPVGVTPPDESMWSRPASEFVWPGGNSNPSLSLLGLNGTISPSAAPNPQNLLAQPMQQQRYQIPTPQQAQPQFSPQNLSPTLQQVLALFSSLQAGLNPALAASLGVPQAQAQGLPANPPTQQAQVPLAPPQTATPVYQPTNLDFLQSLANTLSAQAQLNGQTPLANNAGTTGVANGNPLGSVNTNVAQTFAPQQYFPPNLYVPPMASTTQLPSNLAPIAAPQQPQVQQAPIAQPAQAPQLPQVGASGSDDAQPLQQSNSFDNEGMQEVCKRLQEFAMLCPQPAGTISSSFWE